MGTRQIDGIAPTFAKKPTIRQEDDGERLLFEARILADPEPVVCWYHNGTPVVAKGRFQMLMEKDGNSYHVTLQIDDVTIEDAGKYKVTAKNELGESNANISLNFDSDDLPEEGAKPVFTEKPRIKQSDDGNKIIFECQLVADPPPAIEWYHKGVLVKEDARHKYRIVSDKHSHTVALEVANVKAEDGGEYRVLARNDHGEGHANITLNFEDSGKPKVPDGKAPRFPKKPTIRQEGDSLILECILEAHPFPEISWFLGPKKIMEGLRHKTSKKETGKHTYLLSLEIRDPTTEDGGNYRCNAVNELGDSNANITLNLQGAEPPKPPGEPPVFTEKPKIIPKDSGAVILMECHVKSKTAPQFTWLHDGKPVREAPHIKAKMVKDGGEFIITLEIKNPGKDDGGPYKCNIRNEDGEINGNLNLNIAGAAAPTGVAPSFVEKPQITAEEDGKLIIMECKVRADPKPTITWTKEGVAVDENRRIKQIIKEEKDVYHIRLELRDPEFEDAGIYKCNVKNSAGESNANLTLNIEDRKSVV